MDSSILNAVGLGRAVLAWQWLRVEGQWIPLIYRPESDEPDCQQVGRTWQGFRLYETDAARDGGVIRFAVAFTQPPKHANFTAW